MFSRTRRSLIFAAIFSLGLNGLSAESAGTTTTSSTEAEELYSRANDYVSHISEQRYSYSYIQFYWKRAQSNIDRIARVYPDTPTGRQIAANQVKVGPYELAYFKERVLPRLQEKKLAAFDAVNCSIFLYGIDEARWDEERLRAMESIVEVLARQKRWNEALSASFPVLDQYRPRLVATVFRVAARFQQKKVIDDLLAAATPEQQLQFQAMLGEAMALNGVPRDDIAQFLDEHPEDTVKLGILSGMIEREIGIQHAATLREQLKDGIQKTHYSILKLDVRDDVDSVAKTFFPTSNPEAEALLAKHHAALGRQPAKNASLNEHLAYIEYLGVAAKFDDVLKYASSVRTSDADRQAIDVKCIEVLAQGARDSDSAALREAYAAKGGAVADAAALAEFRGHMDSLDSRLTVREGTFAGLPIKDPCMLAQAITEWSLTPNRSIRGASPWDPVVQKFLPGFENLPLPKSKDVQDASSDTKPF